MDAESEPRLMEVIAQCDATLVEDRDSPDPVAQRRVDEALRTKAIALSELGRDGECAQAWQELFDRVIATPAGEEPVRAAWLLLNKAVAQHRAGQDRAASESAGQAVRVAEHEPDDAPTHVVVGRGLALKRKIASEREHRDEAVALDEEIIRRLGDAVEPELRCWVARALARRAKARLDERQLRAALRDSEELTARWFAESDTAMLDDLTDVLLWHAHSLLRVGNPSLSSTIVSALTILAAAAHNGMRATAHRWAPLGRAPGSPRMQRLARIACSRTSRIGVVEAFNEKRRRAARALIVCRAIDARLQADDSRKRRQLVATARIYAAIASALVGNLRETGRAFEELVGSGDEAVAEAFRQQAVLDGSNGLLGEIGNAAFLAQRADTLGQGDPRIARIAYEEATRPGTPGSPTSRTGALMARLLKPNVGR